MKKIAFKNGQAPYINDTNLNQMQDNMEESTGVVIFEDENGQTGEITLSKDVSNFDYIEIFYHLPTGADGNIYSSTKAAKQGNIQLSICRSVSEDTIQIYTKLVNIAGNLIKMIHSCYHTFNGSNQGMIGTGEGLAIDKVIGYKL